MSIGHRILALLSALAYGLRRSKFALVRLSVLGMVLAVGLAAYALYLTWLDGLTTSSLLGLGLALSVLSFFAWADIQRYVAFSPHSVGLIEPERALKPEEKLFFRGTGVFAVSDTERYLVEVPVVFWSTELGEHIVAAHVRPRHLLGVGVPEGERGWWYVFLEPGRVEEITPGIMAFGLRQRPAVRLVQVTDKRRNTLHFSCDTPEQLSILVDELRQKAEIARARDPAP